MARTPGDFDPDELDARWNDLTSRLGPLDGTRAIPVEAAPQSPGELARGPRDYEVPEDDSGFEEPDPELGNPDPATALSWFALGIGVLGLFVVVIAGSPPWVGVLSTALTVGGLVALLVRLPRHTDRDDDGAQV
ncbi:MAG TPA: hypothetical protein VFC06_01310 [Demequina sp.]|nr:hypothetical protein [Demequina sp.]